MRVAFDIDGVFADMHGALARLAATLFSELGPPHADSGLSVDPSTAAQGSEMRRVSMHESRTMTRLTAGQQTRLWEHLRRIENFWETLDETEPGAVAHLAALAAHHGWHVLFLTERPETAGRTAQLQSQRWLARRGFELPSVCLTRGSRGRIAQALNLDVVVDDRRDNCLDIRGESDTRVILVERARTASLAEKANRLGIDCAPGIMKALALLEQPSRQPIHNPQPIEGAAASPEVVLN